MTSLPDTPDFRALLASLEVSIEESVHPLLSSTWGPQYSPESKTLDIAERFFLHYEETPNATIKALQAKFRKVFTEADHSSDTAIIDWALAIFAAHKKLFTDDLNFFNALLASVVQADTSHFVIRSLVNYSFPAWKMFDYQMSTVADSALKYRTEKAHSNYFELHMKEKLKSWCLSSPIFKRPVMNVHDLVYPKYKKLRIRTTELMRLTILNYFEHLSAHHMELMWNDYSERQLRVSAKEAMLIDIDNLRSAQSLNMDWVTVYIGFSKETWGNYTVPICKTLTINDIWDGSEVVKRAKKIENKAPSSSPEIVRQFCRFGVKAKQSLDHGNLSEALLFYMIAIEIIFSAKEQITKTIARRCAVLLTVPNCESYEKNRKRIEKLYKFRSCFVHDGEAPSPDVTEELRIDYQRLLTVLLRSETLQEGEPEEAHSRWLRKIDHTASGYEAQELPSPSQVESLSLPQSLEEIPVFFPPNDLFRNVT